MQGTTVEELAERLRARRQELVGRMKRIETDLERPRPRDDEDRATEAENDEVLEDLGHAGQRELAAIDAALNRVAAGTYGICLSCGEQIAPERLDAVPTAPRCRACAG